MWVVGSAKCSEIKNSTPGLLLNFGTPLEAASAELSLVNFELRFQLEIFT
jgi:hypothetical protein